MDQITANSKALYNELQFGSFSYGQKREKYDSLLFEFLDKIKESQNVFEIGCGNGWYADVYLRSGIKKEQITLIDLAPSNIEHLKKNGFNAVCADAMDLKLDDKVSDFTICSGVLHHLSNPAKGFSELVRITKPGGYIYLNVYNKWHPYFYATHKLTFPIRWFYWNISKKIFDVIYPVSKFFFQPFAYLALGEFLDDKTGRIHFKDQVLTPQVYLLSKSSLKVYAKKYNCEIEEFRYNRHGLMLAMIIKVNF